MFKTTEINLSIIGMGIIFYSPFATEKIKEEEDYFSRNYNNKEQVAKQVNEGTIVGVCTSSPGDYILRIYEGTPMNEELLNSKYKLRLGIQIRDNTLCSRDLFDLMEWSKEGAEEIFVENGYYRITLCGDTPKNGRLGDNQVINVYLQKVSEMPKLNYNGVPIYS